MSRIVTITSDVGLTFQRLRDWKPLSWLSIWESQRQSISVIALDWRYRGRMSRVRDVSTMAMNSIAWTLSHCAFPNSFVKQIARIACWVFYFLIFSFLCVLLSLLVGLCLSGLVTIVPSMVHARQPVNSAINCWTILGYCYSHIFTCWHLITSQDIERWGRGRVGNPQFSPA